MKIKCPKCRHEYPLREATREEALLEILKMRDVFAPHSKLVFEYVDLFDTVRPIKAAKMLRLLKEISSAWKSGKFKSHKRTFNISTAGIAEAMKIVCNRTFEEPLTNHNYLKKVMAGIAEKEAENQSAQAERDLRKKEADLMRPQAGETSKQWGGGEMPTHVKDSIGSL